MKILAPKYYGKFKCIADKCRHSCCIGWEIDVDSETYSKYEALSCSEREKILKNTELCENNRRFILGKDDRCPNLCDNGLCGIILALGEDYLSDICRLHPRFFVDFSDRREMGLGLVCEEAARIILEDNEPLELVEICGFNKERVSNDCSYDPTVLRNGIIKLIERGELSLREKLLKLEDEYSVRTDIYSDSEWIDIYSELEILDSEWENLLKNADVNVENDISAFEVYFERFLKYLVFRHVSGSQSFDNLRARLGFAILSAKIVMRIFARENLLTKERLFDIIRLYSSEIEYSEDNTAALIFEFESIV